MERKQKPADLIHVYQSSKDGEELDVFLDRPYSNAGFDNYMYKSRMYKGYLDLHAGREPKVYILLDEPFL